MYAGMGGRQAPSSRLTSADRYGESLGVHAEIVAIDTNELSCVHARASAPMDAADSPLMSSTQSLSAVLSGDHRPLEYLN